MAARSESVIQTVVRKISHAEFQTIATADTQTVNVLVPSSADSTLFLIINSYVYVSEAWAATAPALVLGTSSGSTVFNTSMSGGTAGLVEINTGANFKREALEDPLTTNGTNTGTSAAGLTLIGDTTAVNQAANLMNDLRALKEDIVAIGTSLGTVRFDGAMANTFTGGTGVIATLTLGAGTWASKTAGEFVVIVEYINLSAL